MNLQTVDEVTRRRPIWLALSELYLDTELQDEDYDRIASILGASGFSRDELEAIHRYEVCPALENNLWSVAGEWIAFDEEWLNDRCTRCFHRRNNFWHRLSSAISFYFVGRGVWKPVGQRLSAS